MMGRRTWIELATRRDIVKRSCKIAMFVGTVLALLNHGDKLLLLQLSLLDIGKIIITYSVPYCVSTYSAVQNELRHFT